MYALIISSSTADPPFYQLELLDTAGIEQFAAINEFYLKVNPTDPRLTDSPWHHGFFFKDADGFVLVYRLIKYFLIMHHAYTKQLQSHIQPNSAWSGADKETDYLGYTATSQSDLSRFTTDIDSFSAEDPHDSCRHKVRSYRGAWSEAQEYCGIWGDLESWLFRTLLL